LTKKEIINKYLLEDCKMINLESARKFAPSLKRAIKEKYGVDVTIDGINTYKFPRCYYGIYSKQSFPNELRLAAVKQVTNGNLEGVKDLNNICYGNIQPNSITLFPEQWQEVLNQ
jgi:CO dehydrogenase/acetyl-CoA synthase alpha subunit